MFIFRFILPLLLLGATAWAQPEGRLLRFPALHSTDVVFSYAGDLYTVPRNGGTARQLTSHEGIEIFPRFSPDGQQLAFAAQYHGNTEVYVMPAAGGTPRRITWTATLGRDDLADRMGPNNIPMTWTPGGQQVVFRSRQYSFNDFKGQLFTAPVDGSPHRPLPFSVGSWCSYSPDGKRLAMNRVFREFRTWKYYSGGMADDIWLHDLESGKSDNLTNNPAQDVFPMWHGNRVYFLSDRDRSMNLFVVDLETRQTRKLTNFQDFDIKFPSLGKDAIVFEKGGYIFLFNLLTEQTTQLEIVLPTDKGWNSTAFVDAAKNLTGVALSPDGNRLAAAARGELWSLPAAQGVTRRLSFAAASHERNPSWSPDGKWVACVSDRTGENELWLYDPLGKQSPRQLTRKADTYYYQPSWSPDSRYLVWADKKLRLNLVEVATGTTRLLDQSTAWEFGSVAWSPDAQWIAYAKPEREYPTGLWIYHLPTNTKTRVTDDLYAAGGAVFSADGQYLLLVSQRTFNPTYSQTEWNHAYTDMAKPYILALNADVPNPLAPKNDEVAPAPEPPKDDKKPEVPAAPPTTRIDRQNLPQRLLELPLDAGQYVLLGLMDKKLYYLFRKTGQDKQGLYLYDLEKRQSTDLGPADDARLSHDGKKLLLQLGSSYYVVERPAAKPELKTAVPMGDLKLTVNRREEWTQIYAECWRQMRDFFYDPNLHGVDWEAQRKKYEPLLAHVQHRNDLNYILGELIGELNAGHAYVGGGDRPSPERVNLGLLGGSFSREADGHWRLTRLLEGATWSQEWRNPLQEPGAEMNPGEYLLSINGQEARSLSNLGPALVGQGGKLVELTVGPTANGEGSRRILVKPREDESALYYYQWVERNRRKVDSLSGGRLGYLHVPDMGVEGLNMFVRYFYPQLSRDGLVIDVRGNGGGNVSPMLIERLARELQMVSIARNAEPYTNPFQMHLGPKVVLLDKYSASDGDLFPYRFRKLGLGPLIGERSWGGVVGIRGSLPLVDGGYLMKPEFAPYDTEGKNWIIEGYGVDPDIVVVNDPHEEFKGIDRQLERAVQECLERLKTTPGAVPPPPPYPNKSR